MACIRRPVPCLTMLAGAILLVAGPYSCVASDWTQWRGPTRDGMSTEKGLLQEWPEAGPGLLWSIDTLGKGFSSPIIVGDRIYISGDIGEELVIFSLDLAGSEKWHMANGKAWQKSQRGSRSTACYDDGRLYIMNAHGRLACLSAADGREIWAVTALETFGAKNITWGISESVLVSGNSVFLTTIGPGTLMAALDKVTGKTLWTAPGLPKEQITYSSPILIQLDGMTQLISCGSKTVFGIDALSGKLLWQHPHSIPGWVVGVSPVFAGDSVYISNATKDVGNVYRLRIAGGNPEIVWRAEMGNTFGGNVVCVDGMVFGSRKGNLKGWLGVDTETGQTVVSDLEMHSGSVVYADGRFYCLTDHGAMVLVQKMGNALKTVGRVQVVPGKRKDVWSHPVVHNGRLYVRYHNTLWCYDIRDHAQK